MDEMKDLPELLCIYHRGCLDGIGAAWAVNKACGHRDIEYYGAQYSEDPPDVTGKEVIIVDFSYKRVVLQEMAKSAESIVVIDHHKTAEAELSKPIEGVETIFDMDYSGAVLSWIYYFGKPPVEEIPLALRLIQDRDLWRFNLEHTKAFNSALFSYDRSNLKLMFGLLDQCDDWYIMEGLIKEGGTLLRDHNNRVEAAAQTAHIGNCKGVAVPWVNASPDLASDLGHLLSKDFPFAVIYYDTKDKTIYSLRSNEGGTDVSEIAAYYGGGGHKHAAGFTRPREENDGFVQ